MRPSRRFVLVLLAAVAAVVPALADDHDSEGRNGRGAALRVIEGRVTRVGESVAEGGLTVVLVTVGTERETHQLLLAPRTALDEIGLSIEVGDSVRARSFEPDARGYAPVQKILNVSRGEMARLRTMRLDPLWDGAGHWYGADAGQHHGGGGPHHRRAGGGAKGGR